MTPLFVYFSQLWSQNHIDNISKFNLFGVDPGPSELHLQQLSFVIVFRNRNCLKVLPFICWKLSWVSSWPEKICPFILIYFSSSLGSHIQSLAALSLFKLYILWFIFPYGFVFISALNKSDTNNYMTESILGRLESSSSKKISSLLSNLGPIKFLGNRQKEATFLFCQTITRIVSGPDVVAHPTCCSVTQLLSISLPSCYTLSLLRTLLHSSPICSSTANIILKPALISALSKVLFLWCLCSVSWPKNNSYINSSGPPTFNLAELTALGPCCFNSSIERTEHNLAWEYGLFIIRFSSLESKSSLCWALLCPQWEEKGLVPCRNVVHSRNQSLLTG